MSDGSPTRRSVALLAGTLPTLLAAGAVAGALATAPEVARELAPTGRLRAAINLGNPVLARREEGSVRGISVDLAGRLAERCGLPLDLLPYDAAGRVAADARADTWDVAFLATDPVRAADIAFTAPYLVIEGAYMVAQGSPLAAIDDVDRPGVRVAVGRGSAYDLYLTRATQHAALVRAPTSAEAIDLYVRDGLDVVAGVRQPLVRYAGEHPGYRVLPGHFMLIAQAMGIPRGRERAAAYLRAFVEGAKASGFVAQAIASNAQPDAAVAPPAPAEGR